MTHYNLGLIVNAVFRKSIKKPVWPCKLGIHDKRKQRGVHMQPWGWSTLGRLLWILPLTTCTTCTILFAEVTSALEVAQLSDHQGVADELAPLAAQSTGRWLKKMRWAQAAASRRERHAPPTHLSDTLSMLIWLRIEPNAVHCTGRKQI